MTVRDSTPSPSDLPDVGGERPVPSRAGRNLPAAIAVGVSLALLIIVTVFFTDRALFGIGVIGAAIAMAIWELARALRTADVHVPIVPLIVGGPAMIAAAYVRGADALLLALACTVLACLVWTLFGDGRDYLRNLSAAGLVAVYVPFLAGFAAMMTAPHDGARRILAFILTTAGNDIGGYAAGVLAGKHPMAPTISPKKSWEGFAGSALACVLIGTFVVAAIFHLPVWQGALYGGAVVVAATVGDLGESMIKRDLGIKDMGHLLPGHGGLMDRLDSLLVVAPVAWLLLSAWAPA